MRAWLATSVASAGSPALDQARRAAVLEPASTLLRNVKLENRQAKTPQSRPELQATWEQRAAGQHVDRAHVEGLQSGQRGGVQRAGEARWQERVTDALSAQGATFAERELRASVLEQGVGELGRVAGGSRTPGPLRTGRDSLLSSGSHHPAVGVAPACQ